MLPKKYLEFTVLSAEFTAAGRDPNPTRISRGDKNTHNVEMFRVSCRNVGALKCCFFASSTSTPCEAGTRVVATTKIEDPTCDDVKCSSIKILKEIRRMGFLLALERYFSESAPPGAITLGWSGVWFCKQTLKILKEYHTPS